MNHESSFLFDLTCHAFFSCVKSEVLHNLPLPPVSDILDSVQSRAL